MKTGTIGTKVRLQYVKIRDVSTKHEDENGAATYVAVLPAEEILKLSTDGNLRSYIPGHPGKKRNLVHKAIGNTIRGQPDRFSQLNSGFLIGASSIEVDDAKKTMLLSEPSINNGAQSQGEIRLYFEECERNSRAPEAFSIRCEISVEPDIAMRTDIAVARNTATKIQDISKAGKHGYFQDLGLSFKKVFPERKLATSETDVEEEFVDTRTLLQVLWALMPEELMPNNRRSIESRMKAYKNAAYCLQDFIAVHDNQSSDPDQKARYEYFVDMAGQAWKAYDHWKCHADWNGKRLIEKLKQAVREDGEIKEVSDGILFPILVALSQFVSKKNGHWKLEYPKLFNDEDMLLAARRQLYQHQGRPMLMGRSGSAYEALLLLTEMVSRMSAQMQSK